MSEELPDRRLALMFACAHPQIERGARAPLILQTVLGITAKAIASAFLVSPGSMSQRLVRAKAHIKESGIPFRVPDQEEMPERLNAVLDATYAAYSTGWDEAHEGASEFAPEAIWLGSLIAKRLPEEPEAKALVSMMLYAEARRHARRDREGCYVPIDQQDVALWDRTQISRGRATAARLQSIRTDRTLSAGSRHPVGSCRAKAYRRQLLAGYCLAL